MKGDFLAYFKKLADKKNSKWQHVYMHFRTFTQGKCTFGENKRGLVQQICNFKPISNDFYDEQNGENFKMKPPP